jgi:hypothetical protein
VSSSAAAQNFSAGTSVQFSTSYAGSSKASGSITYNLGTSATNIYLSTGTYSVVYYARPIASTFSESYGMALYINGSKDDNSACGGTDSSLLYGQALVTVSGSSTITLRATYVSAVNRPFWKVVGANTSSLCSIYIQKIA